MPAASPDPVRFLQADGTFALRDLPKGEFTLTASAAGGKRQLPVPLAEGEHKTGLEITLEELVTLTGRVVDMETKQPVPGIRMMALLSSLPAP